MLDVKPYIPYADALPQASSGFVPAPPDRARGVTFAPRRQEQLHARSRPQTAGQPPTANSSPRSCSQTAPGYLDHYPNRQDFAMRLYDLEVKWRESGGQILVTALEPRVD